MKDGQTHLAHKAEHAVDLRTGAIVAVTVQDADECDPATSRDADWCHRERGDGRARGRRARRSRSATRDITAIKKSSPTVYSRP
jgi:hypothetical protein